MEDYYNIKNYSNEEIYNILDLNNNPTDRELEASIINKIKQSRSINTESGRKITEFFVSLYDRFFHEEEEEDEEIELKNRKTLEGLSPMKISEIVPDPKNNTDETIIQSENKETKDSKETKENSLTSKSGLVQTTKQLDYVKGKLNPLLKQTIKRVIYIDSQNRDKQYSKTDENGNLLYIQKYISTDFTFDLSEPLRDVVALRLYSISIPYTFYTVNSNFGGNFFYLKGNSSGIDNENFYYKVEIDPGFYDQITLTAEVNKSINNLKNTYTDVSFGTTNMTYDSAQTKANLNIEIKNYFNENDYQIVFPSLDGINIDANGNNPSRYNQSLAAYIGFNSTTYNINSINSLYNLPATTSLNYNSTQTSRDYLLDGSNNYFTIIQYQGPDSYTNQPALSTFTFTLTLSTGQIYSRQDIYNNLNTILTNSPYLTNSSISRIDITDLSAVNYGNSYYKMIINLNKSNTNIKKGEDLKTVIIFPNEITNPPIWVHSTGLTGCFRFTKQQDTLSNQLSDLYSESQIYQSSYPITSNPYIVFKCIASGYSSGYSGNYDTIGSITHNNSGMYVNDMKIVIPNATYTLNQYITAIDNSLNTFNNQYLVFPTTVMNGTAMSNTYLSLNNVTGKTDFYIDINITFTNNNFDISFSNFFTGNDVNGFALAPDISYNLSTTNTWSVSYTEKATYLLNPGDIIFTIYPNSSIPSNPIINVSPWIILMDASYGTNGIIKNRTNFEYYIKRSIQNYQSILGDYPLSNSSFSIQSDGITAIATLTISITNTLTENHYGLYFYDPSNNYNIVSNSWINNLKFSSSYTPLTSVSGKNYALIEANEKISAYSWTLSESTYFTIKAVTTGVVTTNGANDIIIEIPANTYTYEQLFELINNALTNNPLTVGSSISRGSIDNQEYTKFHFNINKIFVTTDYKIVFYDTTSFIKCNFGVSGVKNATWDTTLGYLMGYRNNIEYNLSEYVSANPSNITNNLIIFSGDQGFNTNIYRSFYIILDDYVQNRLNDGLVTITRQEIELKPPSYAVSAFQQCDNGDSTFTGNLTNNGQNQLTQAQIQSANSILANQRNSQTIKIMTQDPYIKDIFGIIPIKQGSPGSLYTEFGGTLQNQERLYFGPVNIHRMRIKLVDDKGNTVDLNNADWSFSFVCEQLYQQSSIGSESAV
jgi:hypothetical protein